MGSRMSLEETNEFSKNPHSFMILFDQRLSLTFCRRGETLGQTSPLISACGPVLPLSTSASWLGFKFFETLLWSQISKMPFMINGYYFFFLWGFWKHKLLCFQLTVYNLQGYKFTSNSGLEDSCNVSVLQLILLPSLHKSHIIYYLDYPRQYETERRFIKCLRE